MVLGGHMFKPDVMSTPCNGGLQSARSNLLSSPAPSSLGSPPPGLVSPTPGHNSLSSPGRAATTSDWLSKVEYALSAPNVPQKVLELTPLLDSCPMKDLHDVYCTVVDRIFSYGPRGWSISQTQKTAHPREFAAVATFLSATGCLLSACSRLLADPYVRFDFPVSKLSPLTRSQLESGQLSPFLAIKLPSSPTSGPATTLHLNSFEFYMFMFAAYIVQPDQTTDNRFVPGESLYPYVLEDYLTHFLPCDGSSVPPLPFQLAVPSSPPQPHPEPASTPHKSLLRHSYLNNTAASVKTSPPPAAASSTAPAMGGETWRSETLVNTFTELWLTQFTAAAHAQTLTHSLAQPQTEHRIAVNDTLRIVRMLIKHLHYFTNSGGPQDVIPLDQLKRSVIPAVKKQLYQLFKFTFSHWPHDASFRLVLETWLSYIQPWRYTVTAISARGRTGGDPEVAVVDRRWQNFIAENVLQYTVVLRQLLPRFFRMDLTASKNAYMLFRIAKVFSQPGLVEMVRAAEAGLDRSGGSGSMLHSLMPGQMSYLEVDETVAATARYHLQEMEGPGAKYSPVFSTEFRQTVFSLLSVAAKARAAASDSLAESDKGAAEAGGTGWSAWLSQVLDGGSAGSADSSEVEELKKTVQYLGSSVGSLADLFELDNPCQAEDRTDQATGRVSPGGTRSPEMADTGSGMVLTPHGRWQVVQGVARADVRYDDDPDLRPIMSTEVTWLVRLLHQLSVWLTARHQDRLSRLYYGGGVAGRCARLVLAPPTTYYTRNRSLGGGGGEGGCVRVARKHPPRIVLRRLADKHVLGYLVLALLLLSLLGWSYTASLLLMVVLYAAYVAARGLWQQVTDKTS